MYSKKIRTMIYFGGVIALKDDFIAGYFSIYAFS